MKYISFAESIKANGDRHMLRYRAYLADGNPAFAAGSLAKAQRNYARAESVNNLFSTSSQSPLIAEIVAEILKNIENNPYGGRQ